MTPTDRHRAALLRRSEVLERPSAQDGRLLADAGYAVTRWNYLTGSDFHDWVVVMTSDPEHPLGPAHDSRAAAFREALRRAAEHG